jgi:hypothetical protein
MMMCVFRRKNVPFHPQLNSTLKQILNFKRIGLNGNSCPLPEKNWETKQLLKQTKKFEYVCFMWKTLFHIFNFQKIKTVRTTTNIQDCFQNTFRIKKENPSINNFKKQKITTNNWNWNEWQFLQRFNSSS